ncbi:MAG TPA: hypothetical protein VME92_09980 [Acetobacteraceae bacterium]|nr:hypothetical protein [Acetobacteraceae bacterium]
MRAIARLVGLAVVAVGMTGLAGCGPTAEEQRAMDQQRCYGYGFQPGSEAFANCLMKTEQHREAQQAADRRAWQAQQAAQQAAQQQQAQAAAQKGSAGGSSSSSSGFSMPDMSGMKCTSTSTTSGSSNNSTTTTNTSCHN